MIWKLLRKHISLPQLAGFTFSNLLGMLIVLMAVQFYLDTQPLFSGEDSFLPENYLVVSKRINTIGGLFGQGNAFSNDERSDIAGQPWALGVGAFTSSQYDARASVGLASAGMSTDMFFESVPDDFVETDLSEWRYTPGGEVPIVLPRSYLALYNFGFAPTKGLPKMSESLVSNVTINLRLRGNGKEEHITGRVIGFGQRLNTILTPQSFIDWSNAEFAPHADSSPTRLIIKVTNTADDRIAEYMQAHSLDVEDDKAEQGRITFLLRVVSGVVLGVGLLISLLSFFILMLSIYLLVQKNQDKLRNLLLIGYPVWRVALPYQALTVIANSVVLTLSLALVGLLRSVYLGRLAQMFPDMDTPSSWPTYAVALLLFVAVSALNTAVVRRKINSLF